MLLLLHFRMTIFSFSLFLCPSSYMFLSLALRYVLDSLKKPPNKKMYLFGLAALDKFKGRLKEFPKYCASIASIPHYSEFPALLRQVHVLAYDMSKVDLV